MTQSHSNSARNFELDQASTDLELVFVTELKIWIKCCISFIQKREKKREVDGIELLLKYTLSKCLIFGLYIVT